MHGKSHVSSAIKYSSIEHGGTSAIYIFMAQLTLFNEAPQRKSVAPQALKNAFLWLSCPSLMRGYQRNLHFYGSPCILQWYGTSLLGAGIPALNQRH